MGMLTILHLYKLWTKVGDIRVTFCTIGVCSGPKLGVRFKGALDEYNILFVFLYLIP